MIKINGFKNKKVKKIVGLFNELETINKVLFSLFILISVFSIFSFSLNINKTEATNCTTGYTCNVTGVVSGGHGTITSMAVMTGEIADLYYVPAAGYMIDTATGNMSGCADTSINGTYVTTGPINFACKVTVTFKLIPASLPTTTYRLIVSTGGTGSGIVGTTAGGISCPGTCTARFNSGSTVYFTATPNPGSTVGNSTCPGTVVMDGDTSCNFNFDIILPPVAANISTSSSTINSGQSVTINWSSNNSNYCIINSSTGGDFTPGDMATSGSFNDSPTTTTTYTAFCEQAPPDCTGKSSSNNYTCYTNDTDENCIRYGGATRICNWAIPNIHAANDTSSVKVTVTTPPIVACVGSWVDTSTCSVTSCGLTGVKQQIYKITTPASNSGTPCETYDGATRLGTTSCSTIACPPVPTASLSASPTSVVYGGRSTLTWSSTNATSCTAGGPWSNGVSKSGSGLTDSLLTRSTFTFECLNSIGISSGVKSVNVSVGAAITPNCTITTDSNYPSAPCSGICANGSLTYSTCPVTVNYRITATAGAGGNIYPSGTVSYTKNSDQQYGVTANIGYNISNVIVDGVSKGAISNFDFINIIANHSISASFALASCSNGATNPPTCNIYPACTNGATNPPTCNIYPACTNGATNPPTCTTFNVCPAPLTQNVTVACDINVNGDYAISGQVIRSQDKSSYPTCIFGTPVTIENSTYVGDDCIYPPISCSSPLTQIVKTACDINANGDSAISGEVSRTQTKTKPACIFGTPITIANSTYVVDNCIYPNPIVSPETTVIPSTSEDPSTSIPSSWSAWSGNTGVCGVSGTETRNCNTGSNCIKLDGHTGASDTRSYTNNPLLCPVFSITPTPSSNPNSKIVPGGIRVPYNSLVKIDWSTSNTQSCTCTYFDTANKTDRSCVSFISSPYKTPILKRDTTYTISCPGVSYGEVINSFSVFVDPINTKYTEQ